MQAEMRPEKQWNLLVVNDEKMVNAMASFSEPQLLEPESLRILIDHSPDNIIVFTGILPICRDENGLAAVLGHGMYSTYITCKNRSFLNITSRDRTRRLVKEDYSFQINLRRLIFSLSRPPPI